jgi:hypothetical protein
MISKADSDVTVPVQLRIKCGSMTKWARRLAGRESYRRLWRGIEPMASGHKHIGMNGLYLIAPPVMYITGFGFAGCYDFVCFRDPDAVRFAVIRFASAGP